MNLAWEACGGDSVSAEAVTYRGGDNVLPSAFDVTGLVKDTTSAALLAAAELSSIRSAEPQAAVELDVHHACAAFGRERHLSTQGWDLPPTWDPIAGDYKTEDGWIRLHTNYGHHRAAVCEVLGVEADRDAVAAAVRGWNSIALEEAVVANNGAAAALQTESDWKRSTLGRAVAMEPLVARIAGVSVQPLELQGGPLPLSGVRVLDLTRVIAGPIATRFLAGYGAEVLRIDPPDFDEVPVVLPIVTAGKRCAFLDLRSTEGETRFTELVANAHILVTSLRGDALDNLGFDQRTLWNLNPGLVVVRNSAYGWSGLAKSRRGFDSLVQMRTGIAETGRLRASADRPTPLPVQALDYGTGYLMATAAIRGITERLQSGLGSQSNVSLARTAQWLTDRERPASFAPPFDPSNYLEPARTEWGPINRVRALAGIAGITPTFGIDPGPLGRHAPKWSDQ